MLSKKYSIQLVWIAGAGLLIFAGCSKSVPIAELLQQGDAAIPREEYDRAADFYHQALKQNPNLSAAYAGLGLVAYIRGHRIEAENNFNRAIALDPHNLKAIGYLSSYYGMDSSGAYTHDMTIIRRLNDLYQAAGAEATEPFWIRSSIKPDTAPQWALADVREAIRKFQIDHGGQLPIRLEQLTPLYLASLPNVELPEHPASNQVIYVASRRADDQGGWGYINTGPETGTIFVNCTHADSVGNERDKW